METIDNNLKQADFFKKSSIDISDIIKMYDEYGYHYNDSQKAFIERYAQIEIHYDHPVWKQDILIRLNPIEAQKAITMDVVKDYNEFLQDDLLIIGDIEKENMTLFLSEKGFYYAGFDYCLINWGNDFENMIHKLMSGDKGELMIID